MTPEIPHNPELCHICIAQRKNPRALSLEPDELNSEIQKLKEERGKLIERIEALEKTK